MSENHILFALATPRGAEETATDKVATLAAALDAEVELFRPIYDAHVSHSVRSPARAAAADLRELLERWRLELEQQAARLRGRNISVRTHARWDYPPYEGIVRRVLENRPDLLIVPGTREDPASPLILTHTDLKLIETCPCPLLLVKTARPYRNLCLVAAVDPLHTHDKPAALDDAILETARMVSSALSAQLLLVHARTPWIDSVLHGSLRGSSERTEPETDYHDRVERQVRELARRHGIGDAEVHVLEGYPTQCIPDFVREHSVNIAALGAVSRSFLKRILIGHTAERLLDALDCDLLISKSPGFRTPVSRRLEKPYPSRA